MFEPGDITAFVNANGIADVCMPAGEYSLLATTPGYNTIIIDAIVVKPGAMRHIELLLYKAAAVA
jgi:hypothetical protein